MRYPSATMTDFQRARRPNQKEERRSQLLRTASDMLDQGCTLADLSLNGLAREAGMTKSNVYRYFESREAVLLDLLVEAWTEWFAAVVAGWSAPVGDPLPALVDHLAETLAARPRLCLLTAALPTVLEQNLSPAAIAAFKETSLAFFGAVADWMAAAAPALSPPVAFGLLHDGVAVLVGLSPLCNPPPAVAQVLTEPRFAPLRRDLPTELRRHLQALAQAAVTAPR